MNKQPDYYLTNTSHAGPAHLNAINYLDSGMLVPKRALCGETTPVYVRQVTRRQIEANHGLCPDCRRRALEALAGKHETITVAGYVFHLEAIQTGIHSEETPDYIASLYCDGVRIGTVENTGKGGATLFHASPKSALDRRAINAIENDVRKVVCFECLDGTPIHWDLGIVADDLFCKETAAN